MLCRFEKDATHDMSFYLSNDMWTLCWIFLNIVTYIPPHFEECVALGETSNVRCDPLWMRVMGKMWYEPRAFITCGGM